MASLASKHHSRHRPVALVLRTGGATVLPGGVSERVSRLALSLMGGFQARAAGNLIRLPSRKSQALLGYLAVPFGTAHPRERLAALLWGGMPEPQARGNLRQALSRIRDALPTAARPGLVLDGSSVRLDPAVVEVDATRLEQVVAHGGVAELEEIPTLYRGELLAGLSIGERPFEDWLAFQRERLHRMAIQGLGRLLSHQQAAGATEAAVRTRLRLLSLDPLQESVCRDVMRLYVRLGRREAALRQYQLCRDALKRELGVPPESETAGLYRQILDSQTPGPDSSAGSVPVSPVKPLPPTNVPPPPSELIGRTTELAEVTDLLATHRLVTLIGAGGIGKTRLSLEIARVRRGEHADGVWVAELAPLSDPGLVPVTVAAALGFAPSPGAESTDRVAAALGARHVLLVLDNCEHVIDGAARMAEAILRADPNARVLATSREPLRAPGEHVYRVLSLSVPPESAQEAAALLETPAVQLFAARTRELDPHFSLEGRTAVVAGVVCRRLDGIPLAIELAGARAAVLGVDGVAAHLDDRFRLLTGGYRSALPRHQTLRATLDWSYELLSAAERAVLRRLAVFPAGFTLESAGTVASAADVPAADVLDHLESLAAKSLVVVEVAGGTVTRFRLLETTRAYALEKLTASGEFDRTARRHAEYVRDLLERAEGELAARSPVEWLASYGRQIDNLRAAVDWALSPTGNAALGVALTAAAVPLWMHLSLIEECRERVERALSTPLGESRNARHDMRLFLALAGALLLTVGGGSDAARAAWSRALQIAEHLDDTEYRLRALRGLYVYHFTRREYRAAVETAERFSAVATTTTDARDVRIGGRMIGSALHVLGDQEEARLRIEPMFEAARGDGSGPLIRFEFDDQVVARSFHGRVLWVLGFPERAMQSLELAVEAARASDHPTSMFFALSQAACPVALVAGDPAASERFITMLLDLSVQHAREAWSAWGHCFRGVLLMQRGDIETGLSTLRAAFATQSETTMHIHYATFQSAIAQGLGRVGKVDEGLGMISDALTRAEAHEERWYLPELMRVKGHLLLQRGEPANAERHFEHGLHLARRQQSLSWELRCATDLARLWRRPREAEAGRELLRAVYGRFSEGFETADLQAARALVEDAETRSGTDTGR